MKTVQRVATAVVVAGCGLALHIAQAQAPGISRTDLQRHDLSTPGREVVQVRVDFAPGVTAPNHSTPARRSSMPSKARCNTCSKAGPP